MWNIVYVCVWECLWGHRKCTTLRELPTIDREVNISWLCTQLIVTQLAFCRSCMRQSSILIWERRRRWGKWEDRESGPVREMKNKYLHTRNQEVSEETAHSLLNAEEPLILAAAFSLLLQSNSAEEPKRTWRKERMDLEVKAKNERVTWDMLKT